MERARPLCIGLSRLGRIQAGDADAAQCLGRKGPGLDPPKGWSYAPLASGNSQTDRVIKKKTHWKEPVFKILKKTSKTSQKKSIPKVKVKKSQIEKSKKGKTSQQKSTVNKKSKKSQT